MRFFLNFALESFLLSQLIRSEYLRMTRSCDSNLVTLLGLMFVNNTTKRAFQKSVYMSGQNFSAKSATGQLNVKGCLSVAMF